MARPTLSSLVRRLAPTRCNLCGERVEFASITEELGNTMAGFGFPLDLDAFETLNHRAYACPTCGSSDRDRLYRLYFDRVGISQTKPRILDFAPSAPLSQYLRSLDTRAYRTADLMMEGVDDRIDITDMHLYPDESFDFFLCSHVLEHVSDDAKAYAELFRVLAPGGSGIVMTPVVGDGLFDEDPSVEDPAERWRRFAQDDHVRLYDRRTLVGRAKAAGFGVRLVTRAELGARALARHGIDPDSVLYVVEKPARGVEEPMG